MGLPVAGSAGQEPAEGMVDFNRDIGPILSENCAFCHGPDPSKREADLRLDTADGLAGVIDRSNRDESELLLRVVAVDDDLRMPPPDSNRNLTPAQIDLLRRWIDQGAKWTGHWSFQPIVRPRPPSTPSGSSAPVHNSIDAFVQHGLDKLSLAPSPEATPEILIRRLSLDLTGLPPSPEQVDQFLSDRDPGAYERLVERMLDSPAYGERMAWDWLDAARYADTNGYQGDSERTMWPWRDWVVKAFNDNMPYNQFTVWQLAGDLLPQATDEQILATAFCRNHMINGEGGRIAEENRVEYVMDMSETVGTVWLGLTLNCCRCHDHKYDPLTNQEYYQLFAFFNQTPVTGAGRDPQTAPVLLLGKTDSAAKQDKNLPKVMVMADKEGRRPTFILQRGLYNKPTDEVSAGLPAFLPNGLSEPTDDQETANRLALARWIVSSDNPLTARVTVNRFWQQLFGIGLVKTTEDFGTQGEIPIQIDLLNWLATEFRESQWNVKRLIRLIVTSHTYRQSSRIANRSIYEQDPDNRLLARGARYRLPSWMLRDQALAVSGLLSRHRGGPGVNTYQPPGIWEEASFGKKIYQRDVGEKLYRRSLYTFWRRIIAPTMFFDSASRQTCTVKNSRTNTPLHALQTLNNVAYVEAARALAQLAIQSTATSDSDRIAFLIQLTLCRSPSEQELAVFHRGLRRTRDQFASSPQDASKLLAVGETSADRSIDAIELASWSALCLAILNLDETLTRE